jgi:LysM repeat protein
VGGLTENAVLAEKAGAAFVLEGGTDVSCARFWHVQERIVILGTAILAVTLAATPGHPWQLMANPAYEPDALGLVPLEDGAEDDSETPDAPPEGTATDSNDPTLRYSADVSDADLEKRFLENISSLSSMSVGYCEAGRLINGVQLDSGELWTVKDPTSAWGTQEVIDAIKLVAKTVHEMRPGIGPLRINDIGRQQGGYMKPHRSHQSGRDVDMGLFYLDGDGSWAPRGKEKTRVIDIGANWQVLKSVATLTDVQVVLVDRKIQKLLYDYALATGENRQLVDSIFKGQKGVPALTQHARKHRDHFHVRFFSPRSQELGRRVVPLLAKKPEENLATHRVKAGDTLGRIATLYGSSVKLIQKVNGLNGTFIPNGRTLKVPLRGPCTKCPVPPPAVIPPRRAVPMQG